MPVNSIPLLSCPFCGDTGTLETSTFTDNTTCYYIMCSNKQCAAEGPPDTSASQAAYDWNDRAEQDQDIDAMEVLEALLTNRDDQTAWEQAKTLVKEWNTIPVAPTGVSDVEI